MKMTTRAVLAGVYIMGLGVISPFLTPIPAQGQVSFGPAISKINDVRGPEEMTQTLNFTVTDADGLVTNVSATVPANPGFAKISTVLSGSNVTMTIVGNFNQSGTNSVEVIAEDDHGFSATNHFNLELWFVPPPPPSFIDAQHVRAGEVLGPLTFSFYGQGGLPLQGTLQAYSDNTKLIPDSNILLKQLGTNIYSITLVPVGAVAGSANITITATAGSQALVFNVTVDPPLFTSQLSINQNGKILNLRFGGVTNATYTVQSSLNLVDWTDFGPVTTSPDSSANFQIQLNGLTPYRFYRVIAR